MTIQWRVKSARDREEELASAFAGLGHPARLQLFRTLLERGPVPAGELAGILPLAPSTVSQHLNRLKRCGLVRSSPHGLLRIYQVDAEAWGRFRRALLPFLTSISAKYETKHTENVSTRSLRDGPA